MARVWSPLVRLAHWTLVGGFAVAWLTEDDLLQAHVWAGYLVAAAVLVRLAWGIVGPEQDRLRHFLRPPGEVVAYLREALTLRSRRYPGHTPAGAVMGLALLLSIGATAFTGMATLAETRNAGPLAPWFGSGASAVLPVLISPARADEHGHRTKGEHGEYTLGRDGRAVGHKGEDSAFEDLHEFFANLTLVLVLLHVTGVLLASYAHRENLVRGMITGRKPAGD
ncbi:cytochrome B [Rhodovastum atsumiense]|uniref:Cytochrome B n=2 Tax=Rhodovastum atsumiense TaxID=504468 RepID=A0A5M6INR9_9PROT|nr:cytochrome B [Rhodovastum atsumiense]